MKLGRIVLVALVGGAVTAVGATGCSLIVDFDASKIDSGIGTIDAPGDDAADAADSTQPDTMVAETSDDAADTAVADSTDTAVADSADTAVADSAVADSADTAVADSADTAVADTAVADTAVADTAVADTAVCGNAIVEGSEACDLGGKNGTLTCNYGLTTCAVCTTTCTVGTPVTSYCSDGKVDLAHETCDDGNTTAGDGCSAGCAKETGYNCTGAPSVCTPICGDSLVKGSEQCDLGAANGTLTCTYGLTTCSVCTSTCTTGTPVTSYCGDSKIDAAHETCDDGNSAAGDGCSAACAPETGFTCVSLSLPSTCASNTGDNNVHWNTLYFNDGTVDPMTETVPGKTYKFLNASSSPLTSTSTLDVYMLADVGDLSGATIRFWNNTTMAETLYPMTWVDTTTAAVHGAASHKYAIWKGTIPAHASDTYFFRIRAIDGTATAYLKNGVPAGSGADCSAATLTQPICSVDTYSTNDWQYTVP
jgi:cysteine-rich repeat protein